MAFFSVQNGIFTLAVTVVSRLLILRDRLLGRLQPHEAVDAGNVSRVRLLSSGANLLDARFVTPATGPVKAGLLLCHGIGETVEHWAAAQQLLARDGVASLVFNYSGYGKSTGWINPQQCEVDAQVAFDALRQLVPSAPLSLLGYSLGSGVATAVAPKLKPECSSFALRLPRCVKQPLASVYQSLRLACFLRCGRMSKHLEHAQYKFWCCMAARMVFSRLTWLGSLDKTASLTVRSSSCLACPTMRRCTARNLSTGPW